MEGPALSTVPGPPLSASVRDVPPTGPGLVRSLRDAWEKTVGTYAMDKRGTEALFERLVRVGLVSREEAHKLLKEAQGRIEHNRRELEQRIEDGVRGWSDRLGRRRRRDEAQAHAELRVLAQDLDGLERRLDELEQR